MKLKKRFKKFCKKQSQPMSQVTYWVLFLACGLTYVMGVVSGAALASYELIVANPEIASQSWLVQGFFF